MVEAPRRRGGRHRDGGRRSGGGAGVGSDHDRDWRRRDRSASESPPTAAKAPPSEAAVVGELTAMCSRDEVAARAQIHDVSRFELRGAAPVWAVKKYRRPAAGRTDVDATQLRPPHVLEATLEHLFTNVVPWPHCGLDWSPSGPGTARAVDFLALYHFLHDRLRSVRQDFVVQRVRTRARVVALVRIARFHVAASFRAAQLLDLADKTLDWSEPLNDQQLASALTEVHALRQSDSGDESLYEEAVAYDVILHLRDPRAVSLLLLKVPVTLLQGDALRRVLALFVSFHTGDSVAFVKAYRGLPVLQRCLALRHLPVVWVSTMLRMNKAFGKIDRFALAEIAQWTDLPDEADARALCTALNVHIEDDEPTVATSSSAVDSWEESIDSSPVPTSGARSGFAKFKINSIRGELDEATERRLVRSKATSILAEVAQRWTATELVMGA